MKKTREQSDIINAYQELGFLCDRGSVRHDRQDREAQIPEMMDRPELAADLNDAAACREVVTLPVRLQPALASRLSRQLGSVACAKLLQKLVHVEFDRVLAEVHFCGYEPVG